ncbi:cytochrome c family protein [Rhodospirillaceae bacterium KN72]|uniref:Cytochrome c family protein n=1 Tax=Pacificispira spongiicola TaxID=2729598 RepID=A0A7Y0E086_9PROT|nr:cytochrome c family protein [Pacificispira spongiicola]NMM44733.1 cytochrome c family protein [Pacificispira spongiicola]
MNCLKSLCLAASAAALLAAGPAFADGDAAKGEKVFKKCAACHSVEPGVNKVGPSLHGVFGRHAGTGEGYSYSKLNGEASEVGLVWNDETLMDYLVDPQKFLETYVSSNGGTPDGRTKMTFKLKKEKERADVIAYLKTLSD